MRHIEWKPLAVRGLFRLQQAVGMTPTEFRAVAIFAFLLFAGMTGRRLAERPVPSDPATLAAAEAAFRARSGPRPTPIPAAADSTNVVPAPEPAADTTRPARRVPGPIDLNTASARDLMTLPRIGPAMAGRILEHRTANGPFRYVDDLLLVRGIGEKTLERLRPLVRVGTQRAQADSSGG